MAKYVFNYETGRYEYIERDGFSISSGQYVYNWDDSQYRQEEEDNGRSGLGLWDLWDDDRGW